VKNPLPRVLDGIRQAFGPKPAVALLLVGPALLSVAIDVVVRHRLMRDFPLREWVNYFGSTLVDAGFWAGTLALLAFLLDPRPAGPRRTAARVALGAMALTLLVETFFGFGAQVYYFRVFDAYISRDTLRLGLELRGTVGAYLAAWGGQLVPAAIGAVALTGAAIVAVRRAHGAIRSMDPWLPGLGFVAALACLFADFVASKGLQPAPPDVCFLHAVAALGHDAVLDHGPVRGVSIRKPAKLPPLHPRGRRPNVLLVITESVRADAICSDPASCHARFLDGAIPERMPLGRMTSQSSGTFTSCMTLWTGLGPDADFDTAHHAPFSWEVAKAVGYHTAYFTSQNLRYRDLGAYVHVGGIDEHLSAEDFGDAPDSHVGAPDERAAHALVEWIARQDGPYFAVLHLSNTHWPYRVDPELQPYAPHDEDPTHDVRLLHNHYRNSVLEQERTIAETFRALKALPSWPRTVSMFVSDHGETFREHGMLYHLKTVFEEEIRVPGFLVAGDDALDPEQRDAVAAWRGRRTFGQDVFATLLDAFGVLDDRQSFPYAERVHGRSLLRAPTADEPIVLLSTTSGVWWDDDPAFGVMQGERKAVATDATPWRCYDLRRDPAERSARPPSTCADLVAVGRATWPDVPHD
jgi:arylsulfatase A-like enzyme